MRIGYARVSKSDEQNTRLQTRALKQAGVSNVFEENASGGRWERPELQRMLIGLDPKPPAQPRGAR
jgi:DNA invertase Pin-like site-specific DNA recombinase